MKKLFWGVILLLLGTCLAQAQKNGELVRVGKSELSSGVESAARKTGAGSARVIPQVSVSANPSATATQPGSVGGQSYLPASDTRVKQTLGAAPNAQVHLSGQGPSVRKPSNPTALSLERLRQLEKEQSALQAQAEDLKFSTELGRSVLFAPLMSSQEIGYSVTVFKTQYNGKEEIFGILPSHALPSDFSHRFDSVAKDFQVMVKRPDGTQQRLGAHVVQISPQSMLDISLVKFDPQAEPFLVPLTLGDRTAAMNEELVSYGFAAGQEVSINRFVNALSFLSVRTNQAIEGAREGFCGSPLLDMNGNIKAIHTGTVENKNEEDVSFGTHATFIYTLLEAYGNNGQAVYDLVLNEHHLATLNVDEYISAFYLYNASGKKILQQNIEGKFSQSRILKALEDNPQARYVQLTSRKAQWTEDDGVAILKEDRSKYDKTKRQHWYNLQTRQIEPTRPDIIKM